MPAPLIVSDPTVELILEELAAGTSANELIAGHLALTPQAISAALQFAEGIRRPPHAGA